MTVPYWVEDAIFYQIFPDRFANGDPAHVLPGTKGWDELPTITGFHGGDLRGVIEKFDYLLDLGINALYFNPIFQATSNHRYNTTDYFKIDQKLGDLRDFRALLDLAHSNQVKVVLDGVFNHCGRGFFAFNDLLENQEASLYKDWFYIKNFPVRGYAGSQADDFQAWWGYRSLPKLNTGTKAVRRYIMDIARYWIEQGADGWRLDVPNEIDDDDFWAEFRQVVKAANPDAYLVGEIWDGNPRWVGEKSFDGLMNYPLRDALLPWLNGKSKPSQFGAAIDKILNLYPRENVYAMYLPLGSHDTERLWTMLGGDIARVKLALLFQFAFPGAPAIYYGDEIGLEGGKDPGCRRTFPWEPGRWRLELRQWVKKLVQLRKSLPVLRRGDYQQIWLNDARGCYVFGRRLGDQRVMVALNVSQTKRNLHLPVTELGWPDGHIVHGLTEPGDYIVSGDSLNLSLPPWSGMILG